ncbi:MAG: DUF6063 family protein [Eubacterium sp.]|nr:DUF6063 family protein [Eubacterium sp.]
MEKSMEKALDIYSVLATGRSLSASDKETAELYNAFYSDSEVYDITTGLLSRLNLKLYEYNESLFVTAGSGNKVFGYTNDDLKKILNLRLNKELFLVYFIMYVVLLQFYKASDTYQIKEYIRTDELLEAVTQEMGRISGSTDVYSDDDLNESSFKAVSLLWDSLPPMISEDKDRTKASRGSRVGYVKLTSNFLVSEGLFLQVDDRLYPTDRLHAIAENYFEDNGSAIRDALTRIREANK